MSSCGSDSGGDLCGSLKAGSDGVHTPNCGKGVVMLSQQIADGSGAWTSYSFVVACGNGKSAHGSWNRTDGLACFDGAYTVCDGGTCVPTSDADCAMSTNCTKLGECGYADGGCVLTDQGCAHSEIPCGLSGACHLGARACAPQPPTRTARARASVAPSRGLASSAASARRKTERASLARTPIARRRSSVPSPDSAHCKATPALRPRMRTVRLRMSVARRGSAWPSPGRVESDELAACFRPAVRVRGPRLRMVRRAAIRSCLLDSCAIGGTLKRCS